MNKGKLSGSYVAGPGIRRTYRYDVDYQQDGNTAVNGNATRAQVLLTWANGLMENTKAKVVARELAVAQGAVVPPVPPVIT